MQAVMELEICVESVEAAIAAARGGADRVELCSALSEGGVTPSMGLIRGVVRAVRIGAYVMIRPRGGDFLYSDAEFALMREDVELAREAGARGVVLGLLGADGTVDVERTRELVKAAGAMDVTFHRALDMARDQEEALEAAIDAGATRVLTSGAAKTAVQGAAKIAAMVRRAKGRIGVMVGGNVRPGNVQQTAAATGASQFHAALRAAVASPMVYRNGGLHLGGSAGAEYTRQVVLERDVARLRAAVDVAAAVPVPAR
jgi:copper homeostasis protein